MTDRQEHLLPDHIVPGRPFATETRLGKILVAQGHTDYYHFCAEVDISPRQFSRYLAGEEMSPVHLARIAKELGLSERVIMEEEHGGMTMDEMKKELTKGQG